VRPLGLVRRLGLELRLSQGRRLGQRRRLGQGFQLGRGRPGRRRRTRNIDCRGLAPGRRAVLAAGARSRAELPRLPGLGV
jgi:hypothetical protein